MVGRLDGESVGMKAIPSADEAEEGGTNLMEVGMLRPVTVVWYGCREVLAWGCDHI